MAREKWWHTDHERNAELRAELRQVWPKLRADLGEARQRWLKDSAQPKADLRRALCERQARKDAELQRKALKRQAKRGSKVLPVLGGAVLGAWWVKR